jgi:hypothetical protein
MVECADLTLLAADAFAYERPRRDPPSSIRRPGSAIFVQYGPAPDLALPRTSSLGLEAQLLPQNRLLGGVHSVNLENVFRRIHANSANLFHGWPPLSEIYSDLILARLMPSGAVHTNRRMKLCGFLTADPMTG